MQSLPEVGPFGEELKTNENRSVVSYKNLTSGGVAGKAELHENYNDIFLVQEGEEELFIGGEIKDKQEVSSGEWRGENLEGYASYRIKAGDTVVIPKGIAHRHGEGIIKFICIKTS